MVDPAIYNIDTIRLCRTAGKLREIVTKWRSDGARIALVPTMGALHDGHFALIDKARGYGERVIVSIFVNPAQFEPDEDFTRYPRQEDEDLALLEARGVDLLYAPSTEEMYPPDFATKVEVAGVTEVLDGIQRPSHFAGVTTVVTKLLLQALPDYAVFGEKDYQQLLTIRNLVTDLNIPVEILAIPTVRERDGLAASSRNRYLSEKERDMAGFFPKILAEIIGEISTGLPVSAALEQGRAHLRAAGIANIDYLELRDAENLAPVTVLQRPARVFGAITIGATHLIDNWPVAPHDTQKI